MFDIAPTELMLVALVALVVIGPKDLPKLMRTVGYWVGRARGVARHFRSGMDEMMRQAEIEEMEKRWADENARIMREHPATDVPAATSEQPDIAPYTVPAADPVAEAPAPADPPVMHPIAPHDDAGRAA
jgi:sec-independent protein translocase protein TatB